MADINIGIAGPALEQLGYLDVEIDPHTGFV